MRTLRSDQYLSNERKRGKIVSKSLSVSREESTVIEHNVKYGKVIGKGTCGKVCLA